LVVLYLLNGIIQLLHIFFREKGIRSNFKRNSTFHSYFAEKKIVVPEGITEIASQAFYQNKKLTGLYLPDGVKSIGNYTVNGCESLEYVRVPESVEILGEDVLVKKIESKSGKPN
jgi:hypothetical protein